MNPEKQTEYSDDIEPNVRPQLGVIQGGGESTPRESSHLQAAPNAGSEDTESNQGLSALEGGGETTEPKRGHLQAVSGSGLSNKEDNAANNLNYTSGNENEKNAKAKQADKARGIRRFLTKKNVSMGGGIGGGIFTIGLFGMTFVSGPLEFIHVAEILHDSHFSHNEDAGDGRMGKLYRFIRSKGTVGTTRLSWLGNEYHDRIINKLSNIGIEPEYGKLSTYKGFTVDIEHENSPYKGMTPEEASAAFKDNVGITPNIVDGKLQVDATTFWNQRKSLKASLSLLGDNAVTTAVRTRIMGKFGFVTWHPLKILDKKINNSLAKIATSVKEKWKNRLSNGEEPPVGVETGQSTEGTDQNGKPIPTTPEEQQAASATPSNANTTSKILSSLAASKTLKITGGVAALVGISCALKAVNDNVGLIRYTQVVVPLMRMGFDVVTVAYQLMAGLDVDPYELQTLSQNFSTVDKVTGKTTTWYDNTQIRADVKQTGGVDSLKKDGTKDLITQSSIPWLAWTAHLGPICTTAGQAITGIVSIGVGIITGGVASTIAGFVAGASLTGPIINKASQLLAGNAVDTSVGANPGPTWGGQVDEGGALAGNAQALSMGGVALSSQQAQAVQRDVQNEQAQQFKSEGILARMFDISDYRSLTGRLADTIGPNSYLNMNNWLNGMLGSFGNVLSLPFNLASSTVHADTTQATSYDYGFPIYGFSEEDQNNSLVADPIANGETVAKILDKNNTDTTPNWIQKAHDCFGVNITNTAQGWDVIPNTDIDMYDSTKYNPADCAGPPVSNTGNVITTASASINSPQTDKPIMAQTASTPVSNSQAVDWFRIRFFILDTSIMEGYTCANFNDDQSCQNDGMSSTAASADSSTLQSSNLANQILSNSKITLSDSARADLQATVSNQQVTPGPAASGVKCTPSPVFLNAQLLQGILAIANNYSFTIDNLVSGHACDTTRHPLGRAVDITQLNKVPIDWTSADLAADKQFATDVANTMYSVMPTGTLVSGQPVNMPGVGVCHQDDIAPPPIGVNYFTYQCDRLLVDVGVSQ